MSGIARPRSVRTALAVITCLLTTSAAARAAAEQGAWTLRAAGEHALQNAPAIKSAEAARQTALAYRTFGEMPRVGNPLVSVRAMIGKPDDPAATYAVLVGLPFDVARTRKRYRREARFVVEEAEARLLSARNDVRSEARAAYVDVAFAIRAESVARESAANASAVHDAVKARLAAGSATALDLAMAETTLADANADIARAARTRVEAEQRLRQALGLRAGEPVQITELNAPQLPQTLTRDGAVKVALERRRELRAFESERERYRAADARLRAEAVAPLTANLEAERQGNRSPNQSVGASVGFALPFVITNQGERAVTKQRANAAEVERTLVAQTIAREVLSSYAHLEAALAEVQSLEKQALPAAERTLEMVGVLLKAGAVDYFRLLTARREAVSLRMRRVDALREAWLSRIALERAVGGLEEQP